MAAALLAGTVLTGCDDFLEATNKSAGGQTSDEFFSSNPTSMLYSAFASLRTAANQYAIYDEGTDLYTNTRGHSPSAFGSYSLTADNSTVKTFYVTWYGIINYANGVIKYANASSMDVAEARFLRAYSYYRLTQHFGAVPYVTSYIESASRNYPRTPLSQIYPALIEELKDLYNHEALADMSAHDGHVSKQAVAGLLAKVELAAGWDLNTTLTDAKAGTYSIDGTSYFAEAAEWAEKAIAGVTLYSNFEDKWLPSNEANNQEEIFSVQFERANDPGGAGSLDNCLAFTYGGYPTGEQTSGLKYVNSDFQQNEKAMYLFEKGDARYEATFMTTFFAGADLANGYMSYYSGADINSHAICAKWFPAYMTTTECETWINDHLSQLQNIKTNVNAAISGFKAALLQSPNVTVWTITDTSVSKTTQTLTAFNAAVNNGLCVKKYDDPESTYNDQCYRNIVLMHTSELYLVAAEAYLMAGQTSQFWTKINAIRNRAGLASLSSISDYNPLYSITSEYGNTTELDLLLDERARECYAEQNRWEDLRRTKQLIRYNAVFNTANTTVESVKWLRPIPDAEIQNNDAISQDDQNEGY